jgi:hypothetical protein
MDIEYPGIRSQANSQCKESIVDILMHSNDFGDLTVERNIKNVPDYQDSLLSGMDSKSNVIWMFLQDQIFLCRYANSDETYSKQLYHFYDICRTKQPSYIRPVIHQHHGMQFAIFTNGTDLIGLQLFSTLLNKCMCKLGGLIPGEHIVQMSNPVENPLNSQEEFFCSVTSAKRFFLHKICANQRTEGIDIQTKELTDGQNLQPKSLLARAWNSLWKPEFHASSISKAKLVLSPELILDCLVEDSMEEIVINLNDAKKPYREAWHFDLLSKDDVEAKCQLLDAVVYTRDLDILHIYVLVQQPAMHDDFETLMLRKVTYNTRNGVYEQVSEELIHNFNRSGEKHAFGRLSVLIDKLFIVFKEGGINLVFENTNGNTKIHKQRSPIVGMATLDNKKGDDKWKEFVIFLKEGKRIVYESKHQTLHFGSHLSICSSHPSARRFPKQDQKQLGDLVINGFHDFYVNRTNGYIRDGINFEQSYLDDLIKHIVQGIVVNMTSNLQLVKLMNTQHKTGKDSLVIFDLKERRNKILKFKQFLKQNKLYEQCSNKGKLEFLTATEQLIFALRFRLFEEADNEKAVNENARRNSIYLEDCFKSMTVYEKPSTIARSIAEIIEKAKRGKINKSDLGEFSTLVCSSLEAVQVERLLFEKELDFSYNVSSGQEWWLHRDETLTSAMNSLWEMLKLQPQSQSSPEFGLSQLTIFLIKELSYSLKMNPNQADCKSMLTILYNYEINQKKTADALVAAIDTGNTQMMISLFIKQNMVREFGSVCREITKFPSILELFIEEAIKQICSDASDEDCKAAIMLLNYKKETERIQEYLAINYPHMSWLICAKYCNHADALGLIPENGLVPIAFKSLINLELGHQNAISYHQQIYQEYIDSAILSNSMKDASVAEKVKFILRENSLSPQEKIQYAVMYGLSASEPPHKGTSTATRMEPVFRFLLHHDREIKTSPDMLHVQVWPIVSKAMAALDFKSYAECIRMNTFSSQLTDDDWNTVARVTEAVGFEIERPTSSTRQFDQSSMIAESGY